MFFVSGFLVYIGKTELIHTYHQNSVTDKKGYGKAMGTVFMLTSIPSAISSCIAFFSSSTATTVLSFGVLFAGLIAFFIALVKVQNKFNGSIF